MREPELLRVADLDPGVIDASRRLRPVTDSGVAALMLAIKDAGQIRDAIHVREVPARKGRPKQLRLIAGAHRLRAAAALGLDVPAKVWRCTDDQAALMEIDDQVAGRGLDALDLSIFLGQRKAVFERLHPEAKQGGDRRSARFQEQTEIISFCSATAEQFGMTERHVRNYVRIGETLIPQEIGYLRGSPKPIGVVALIALAKIGDLKERVRVCEMLGAGEVTTVSKARAAFRGVHPPVKSPVEQALITLLEAWERAPKAAKRRFVAQRAEELRTLLEDRGARA